MTILREDFTVRFTPHTKSDFFVELKHFSVLVYCGVGWSLLDNIEMPRVLQRLSQMTNTVHKTTELILFGPLPVVYSLNTRERSLVNEQNVSDLVFLAVRRSRRPRTQQLAMRVGDVLTCLSGLN